MSYPHGIVLNVICYLKRHRSNLHLHPELPQANNWLIFRNSTVLVEAVKNSVQYPNSNVTFIFQRQHHMPNKKVPFGIFRKYFTKNKLWSLILSLVIKQYLLIISAACHNSMSPNTRRHCHNRIHMCKLRKLNPFGITFSNLYNL